MDRQGIVSKIEANGIIAVIRLTDGEHVQNIVKALADGGIRALEVTMTTPNALESIKKLSDQFSNDFIIGVGTVLDAQTATAAIRAGAQFVVSPVLDIEVIRAVHRYDKAAFPGAFTPTEILTAWENGADVVKVFPATVVGPGYFRDIHGPLPQVKLTPTGGVSLGNAAEFIQAGACCLGVGSALLDKKMIANSDWTALAKHAAAFVREVDSGRAA